ncbi:adenylyl-sulfate kinase [Candidatus Alkanophaga liquidiphilum]|nr:Adenylylsulfate kinase or related kinase [Candidatus Alkanophaga liquidiphilum]
MQREEGWALWVTGLPGCGKTAISREVKELLAEKGINVKILELDEIRKVVTPNPTYTDEERDIVYAALAYMAKLLCECGVPVIIDATAHRRKYRERARALISRFAEVHVKCPLEVCMQRERKRRAEHSPPRIYEKARQGARVPGVSVPYEEPLNPEVVVESDKLGVAESAKKIVEFIFSTFER